MNKTKPPRENNSGKWTNSWSVWGQPQTIESRASFRFLLDRAHRNRCRLRGCGSCHCNPSGSIGFSPDGRLLHIALLIRATAAWDEKPWCSHPSKSGRRRPLLRFESRDIVDEPACLEGRAAQRCTKVALCLEPVLGAVASVSQSSPLALSHQKPICLLGYLKYLQSSRQFWTNTKTHAHWRKCSEWIWVW